MMIGHRRGKETRKRLRRILGALAIATAPIALFAAGPAAAQEAKKPNIVFIMGDDVGWFNIGAYHRGIMSGKTPNLDKLAAAGHAVHRLLRRGELHRRPGQLHHRRAADPHRADDRRPGRCGRRHAGPGRARIATALKAQGYATGQFGKNHLGDLNKFLPTVHGFDEFFGYLYHLDAMSDPYWYSLPAGPGVLRQVRAAQPRPLLGHRQGRPDRDAALGQGRQAEDRGRGAARPVHEHGRTASTGRKARKAPSTTWKPSTRCWSSTRKGFMDKAKKDGKPFFIWHNTTRMHVLTFLSPRSTRR